jgi:hypothetical protein
MQSQAILNQRKTAFTVLEKHSEPYAETAKVRMFFDCVQMDSSQQMQIAKSQVMDTYANNFTGAVAYLAWKVAEI